MLKKNKVNYLYVEDSRGGCWGESLERVLRGAWFIDS